MFRLNAWTRAAIAGAALCAGTAFAQSQPQTVPQIVVDAALNEQKGGTIVEIYLDKEITTAEIYRVIMKTPDCNRRLTIRGDGVVLNDEKM
jgi:hypothetical protein